MAVPFEKNAALTGGAGRIEAGDRPSVPVQDAQIFIDLEAAFTEYDPGLDRAEGIERRFHHGGAVVARCAGCMERIDGTR